MTQANTTRTPRAMQAEDTRNRVYEAAIEEYKRVGVENAHIEKIVARAKVSVGTFYRYFPKRHDVLQERRLRNALAAIKRFDSSNKREKNGTLRQLLLRWRDAVVIELSDKDWKLNRKVTALMTENPEQEMYWIAQTAFDTITQKISEGQSNEKIRGDISAKELCHQFSVGMFGFLCSNGNDPQKTKVDIALLIDLFITSIDIEHTALS